jgi:hypothetical protein
MEVPRGPWHLGRLGSSINVVAMSWVFFITVILAIPDNMRAGKTIVGLTVALSAWYLLAERHRFRGPGVVGSADGAAGFMTSVPQVESLGSLRPVRPTSHR